MTSPLEQELDICEFLKKECLEADDEQIENYCAINYENCLEYRKMITDREKRRYEKK